MSEDREEIIDAGRLVFQYPKPSRKSRFHKTPAKIKFKKGKRKLATETVGDEGCLECYLDVFDVLHAIFGYLDPVDLIQVARCAKGFAVMLLSGRNKSIWAAARQHQIVPIPAPLFPLEEHHWVSILFPEFCHICSTPVGGKWKVTRLPEFGLALCIQCFWEHTQPEQLLKNCEVKKKILPLIPSHHCIRYGHRRYYVAEYEAAKARYIELELEEKNMRQGKVTLQEFCEARLERVKSALENAKAMQNWHNAMEEWVRATKRAERAKKLDIIKQGLYQKGYTDADFPGPGDHPEHVMWWRGCFCLSLASTNWDSLPLRLEEYIQQCRGWRSYQWPIRYHQRSMELRSQWQAWMIRNNVKPIDYDGYPSITILLEMEAVQCCLRESGYSVPVTQGRFEQHVARFMVFSHLLSLHQYGNAEL